MGPSVKAGLQINTIHLASSFTWVNEGSVLVWGPHEGQGCGQSA